MRRACVLLLTVLVLAGCGEETASPRAEGGDEPTTARALAAVAAEHTRTPDTARRGDDFEELGRDVIAADLAFDSTGEDDGNRLSVAVAPSADVDRDLTTCGDYLDGCEEVEGGLLMWEAEAPEEDPGGVYLVVTKGENTVFVFQSSEPITADPRELDLQITVQDMLDIAHDPRVDLTTSQAAIDAGEELAYWEASPRDY